MAAVAGRVSPSLDAGAFISSGFWREAEPDRWRMLVAGRSVAIIFLGAAFFSGSCLGGLAKEEVMESAVDYLAVLPSSPFEAFESPPVSPAPTFCFIFSSMPFKVACSAGFMSFTASIHYDEPVWIITSPESSSIIPLICGFLS